MQRTILIDGTEYNYEYVVKRVKNINLSVNVEKMIRVSANSAVSIERIEDFIIKNKSFILRAFERIDRLNKGERIDKTVTEKELVSLKNKVDKYVRLYYPYFEKLGVKYPEIKYRKMVSRWGSCHYKNGKIVFNSHLSKLSDDLTEYVVVHELCHFKEPNHGARFYSLLGRLLPDYKERRKRLKRVVI